MTRRYLVDFQVNRSMATLIIISAKAALGTELITMVQQVDNQIYNRFYMTVLQWRI